MMICVDNETFAHYVGAKYLETPDNSETLFLSDSVVFLGVLETSAPGADEMPYTVGLQLHQLEANLVVARVRIKGVRKP